MGLRFKVDDSRQDSFLILGLIAEGWLYGWLAGEGSTCAHEELREEGLYRGRRAVFNYREFFDKRRGGIHGWFSGEKVVLMVV